MGWRRAIACDRAAEWMSLELDGEISRLERSALHRHLARCEDCRSASTALHAFTKAIRGEPEIEP